MRGMSLSEDNKVTSSVKKTDVERLRQSITEEQRRILNGIWHHFRENNKWMSSPRVHHTFGKPVVHAALCPLGGSVVAEIDGGQDGRHYELTLLGILLTDQGVELETLLVRYLTFLRDRFESDPDFDKVTNGEVETTLGLSFQQSQLLYWLINKGHLSGGISWCSPEGWNAGPIPEVDDLPSISDLRTYLHTLVMRGYDPAAPVLVSDRIRYAYGARQPLETDSDADEDRALDAKRPPLTGAIITVPPRRIFLSHSGVDKQMVRGYYETLRSLGFEPWLDEDAMTAGDNLERGLLAGMKDSCAAVFFVTGNYKDEGYLATEIEYAIAEKREKEDRYAIITLVLSGTEADVPELLRRYVWKTPKDSLETLREILRGLPLQLPAPEWKSN